eukprot:CAMPEP_0177759832 /NCGR_PEP_ID=MMETSP0491_2-20121128/4939_1 /TAXON_ID=63592 /ORGANISM="Tetraselmis chuii, Strain PLY429" /LENGTH=150 /DNA_ID=CAMNT_0019275681 /DNA_START=267 /DNA_END=722 /DNA_ORIENTATION=+
MADLALATAGGKVILATCYDERFPPESVIDGNRNTLWATTGLFPQEIVVSLPEVSDVKRITTVTMHVKKLIVETCSTERPVAFEKAFEADLTNTKNQLQTETHQQFKNTNTLRAKFIKFIVESGYQPFAGVGKLSAEGGRYLDEEVEDDD